MKKFIIILFVTLFCLPELFAQIGTYPQVIFMNAHNRSSNMRILNSSDKAKEVSIDLVFGYPGYDSLGYHQMQIGDTLPSAEHYSAKPFVKVFPKRLLLDAGEEQTIRFMARNIADLKDGTYFCRIVIESYDPDEDVDTTYKDEVKARLKYKFVLMSALIFQKGQKTCEMKVNNISANQDSSNVNFVVDFDRNGNSPFYGTVEMNIFDSEGDEIANVKELTPVYFNSKKAFTFNKDQFNDSRYRVQLIISNEHKDVPKQFKIPFEEVEREFWVDFNGES